MKKSHIFFIAILVIIFVVGTVFFVQQINEQNSQGVSTYEVEYDNPIEILGKVSPKNLKIYLYNNQFGAPENIEVSDGDQVGIGDTLFNYDEENSARDEIVEKLEDAENQSDQNLVDQYENQLSQYDSELAENTEAAFDGTIAMGQNENIEDEDNESILTLISEEYEILTTISEFDLEKISEGDVVDIEVSSTGTQGTGEITWISQLPTTYDDLTNSQENINNSQTELNPSEEESDQPGEEFDSSDLSGTLSTTQHESGNEASSYSVKIENLDFEPQPGYSVEISIPLETIRIPKNVLLNDETVMVVDENNTVEKRQITIKERNNSLYVLEGLEPGDRVIQNPDETLEDGDEVEVSQ